MSSAFLALKDLSITLSGATIIQHMSFSVRANTLTTLLGPSGSGKTTVLRAIAGLNTRVDGEILLDGQAIQQLPANQRQLGMIFQSYALFPNLSVFDNVAYGLRVQHQSAEAIEQAVTGMLATVNLSDKRDAYPHNLSGGQQQRVAIARSLVLKPKLLLLDEPLSALDAQTRVDLRDQIRDYQQKLGITMLFVTHDQAEAMAISDDIIVMNAGHVQQQGAPMAIYTQPANVFMAQFIGHHNLLTGDQLLALGCHHTRTQAVRAAHHYIVRPELFFREEPQNAGPVVAIAGHLISATMLGDRIRYRFATAVDQLTLTVERLNHTTPLALNQPLTLYLREHDVQEVGPHA
ncbi:ABC transporter ATP-binding protein [Levilactobacillus spicheri]|uniref:Spermidine/putrescine ABC transporter ATP-binding protein n=2 Tax=Levilactobacillus spicheri TaxID=216463 RepID=A0ABQ0WRC3_9LACO|nr:ABC transporter ATP-binding protein [Levilactobacillus spicheri]KRL46973.1 ABC superfamily ATP binding cassette transporter, ABC protein [Levilactobacillus spicheri DSM 15429]GEO66609.1 spermidine/putrescine ABC transporter ATP-binding protein [Levilactobacillus spicheri]